MAGSGRQASLANLKPAQAGNTLALRHGATSDRQIGREAANQKRRILRQIGLRARDLDSLGRALLANWARAAAALALMDAYAAEHGWLDNEGNPRGFARLYVSMLNAERLALTKLEGHLRSRATDPEEDLQRWLDTLPEVEEEEEDEDEDAAEGT
jgi:hypothetical protein